MYSLRTTLVTLLALRSISPVLGAIDTEGCYDNFGELDNYGAQTYQTQGLCRDKCIDLDKAVWAVTKGSTCFCGDAIPSEGKVSMNKCDVTCQGYGESCGGQNEWLFGYTGVLPPSVPKPSTSKSSSKSSDIAVQTTVISQDTATVTADPNANGEGGSTNKAGIAAGVVVGVIFVIAACVGGFLVMRRNRRRQAEEEYRAAVAAKEFTASIKKPQSDSRLDPVMMQRRMSDGSIADNQDYSRRILKVTNPDA